MLFFPTIFLEYWLISWILLWRFIFVHPQFLKLPLATFIMTCILQIVRASLEYWILKGFILVWSTSNPCPRKHLDMWSFSWALRLFLVYVFKKMLKSWCWYYEKSENSSDFRVEFSPYWNFFKQKYFWEMLEYNTKDVFYSFSREYSV